MGCAPHLIDRVAFMRLHSIRIDGEVRRHDHDRNFNDINADEYLRGTTATRNRKLVRRSKTPSTHGDEIMSLTPGTKLGTFEITVYGQKTQPNSQYLIFRAFLHIRAGYLARLISDGFSLRATQREQYWIILDIGRAYTANELKSMISVRMNICEAHQQISLFDKFSLQQKGHARTEKS